MDGVTNRREWITQLVSERGQEFVLSAVGLFQCTRRMVTLEKMSARKVLAISGTQRATDRVRQRGYPDGPLEQDNVAQRLRSFANRGGIDPLLRQHQYWKIGPRRLLSDDPGERLFALPDGFLCQQQR